MTTKLLLKDLLFNENKIRQIAQEIQSVYTVFDTNDFINTTTNKFSGLELKQRISWIRECLKKYLPEDYKKAVEILLQSLPKPNNPELTDNDFGDFIYAPYAEFVAKYGCKKIDLQFSFAALKKITQRFSAEDAIRYFINAFPKETIAELLKWSKDSHYHVRRLTSEGTRPKLPWAQKINIPVESALPILDNLYTDSTRYVTRSVANHLNDVSKINPTVVLQTLEKWQNSNKQIPTEMDYIIHHSLRTLIKQGYPQAFTFLKFSDKAEVILSDFTISNEQIQIGSMLSFSFTLTAKKEEHILIDYIISFQNKHGEMNSKKVFKYKKLIIKKNQTLHFKKNHPMRDNMTTRTIYPGKHRLDIQINGSIVASKEFEVSGFVIL